jgi:subfamily B ATP-binding cassette protein MsbA
LSTIKDADEILVMKYGEVKERGSHAQLVAQNGIYKKLISKQLYGDKDGASPMA